MLGEQLENPYTVENMKKALENLTANGKSSGNTKVRTTHLYLKFSPQDEKELDLLKSDNSLEWYDYPLDYKMISGGLFYHDPEVPEDVPTYQYVAIEVDKDLPNVAYEVLAELYLPEEDEELTNGRNTGNSFMLALEIEALLITGNYTETTQETNSNAKASGSSWNPAGRVRVWDDVIGTHTTTTKVFDHWEYYDCDDGGVPQMQKLLPPEECKRAIYRYDTSPPLPGSNIPLQGVKVRANSWFKTKTTLTDAQGNYTISSFNNPVNYSIKWETNDYDIRDGLYAQAYFTGPKQKGDWNVDLVSGKALRHGTIHRAAHRYFYQNIGGLLHPTLSGRLKISYLDEAGVPINWGNIIVILPNIRIYRQDPASGRNYNTNEIFSSSIHEIAHSTHIDLVGNLIDFGMAGSLIRESWAEAVEWYISKIEYNERGMPDYDDPNSSMTDPMLLRADHKQWWDNGDSNEYTPLFIDLVDDFDQANHGPDDRVTGYSMQILEINHLREAASLSSLGSIRTSLKQRKPTASVTDQQIDDYFDYYFNL